MNPSLAIWCCSSKQHAHTNKKTGKAESYVQMYLDAHKAKAEADAAASEQA